MTNIQVFSKVVVLWQIPNNLVFNCKLSISLIDRKPHMITPEYYTATTIVDSLDNASAIETKGTGHKQVCLKRTHLVWGRGVIKDTTYLMNITDKILMALNFEFTDIEIFS